MAKFNDKISTLINAQLPEFVVEQHPKFASFLKSYYQLLESAELQVEQIETTDGILLETETNQENLLILDAGRLGSTRTQLDSGDKVLTEDTAFGKFQNAQKAYLLKDKSIQRSRHPVKEPTGQPIDPSPQHQHHNFGNQNWTESV